MHSVLYLHGLNGPLSAEKRAILESSFTLLNPTINYLHDNVNDVVSKLLIEHPIDIIIGEGIGGYVGYHTSRKLQLPCLIFNPVVKPSNITINYKAENKYEFYSDYLWVVLGKKNQEYYCEQTYLHLAKDTTIHNINFSLYSHIAQEIDVVTFENEVNKFYNSF